MLSFQVAIQREKIEGQTNNEFFMPLLKKLKVKKI